MHDNDRSRADAGFAWCPEDLVDLLVARGTAGDLDGLVALYEPDAVIAYPPGRVTRGRAAIRAMWAGVLSAGGAFDAGPPMPTLIHDDLALVVTAPEEAVSARAQVLRRQVDGRWLRLIDQPPFGSAPDGRHSGGAA